MNSKMSELIYDIILSIFVTEHDADNNALVCDTIALSNSSAFGF